MSDLLAKVYTEQEQKRFKAFFKAPAAPAKRKRGRPKGSKRKRWGGCRKETTIPTQNQQQHIEEGKLVTLTQSDVLVQNARPANLQPKNMKSRRINWSDPKYKDWMDRVCHSWKTKTDLCCDRNESMRSFCARLVKIFEYLSDSDGLLALPRSRFFRLFNVVYFCTEWGCMHQQLKGR